MPKLTFDEALQAINEERCISPSDVRADALRRVVWVAEWHIPGCLSESRAYLMTKRDAIAEALQMCDNARGAASDLRRYGRTDKVSPDAYVSMATTTIEKHTLSSLL
jgi:hypothetical protein